VNKVISGTKHMRYGGYWPVMVILAGLLIVFPQVSSFYSVILVTEVLIYAIFATSLNLELGYTGLPSLGHAAFFGVGGYTLGILVVKGGIHNFWFCMIAVLLASGVVSSILGFFSIRTSGAFFLMLTFALAQFVWGITWSWRSLTGGDDGTSGISRPELGLPLSMSNEVNFYYLVLLFSVLAIFILYRVCRSPFGHVLQGIRESETRMQVLGYNTWKYKYVAFIVAGIFGGLAGALKAYQDGFVSPAYPSVMTSGMVLLMCLVGGTRVFLGPTLGAAAVWIIRSLVSSYTEYWSLVLGCILIVAVMFAPQGIAGYLVQVKGFVERARAKS
jgi:branched-chain amino acid transport system permease protein